MYNCFSPMNILLQRKKSNLSDRPHEKNSIFAINNKKITHKHLIGNNNGMFMRTIILWHSHFAKYIYMSFFI